MVDNFYKTTFAVTVVGKVDFSRTSDFDLQQLLLQLISRNYEMHHEVLNIEAHSVQQSSDNVAAELKSKGINPAVLGIVKQQYFAVYEPFRPFDPVAHDGRGQIDEFFCKVWGIGETTNEAWKNAFKNMQKLLCLDHKNALRLKECTANFANIVKKAVVDKILSHFCMTAYCAEH